TLDPHFVSNQFISSTLTTFRYVNANDTNNNGYIDDVEFSESEIKKEIHDVFFANLNINLGLSYQFGRENKKPEPVSMISLDVSDEDTSSIQEKEVVDMNPLPDTDGESKAEPVVEQNNENITDTVNPVIPEE